MDNKTIDSIIETIRDEEDRIEQEHPCQYDAYWEGYYDALYQIEALINSLKNKDK